MRCSFYALMKLRPQTIKTLIFLICETIEQFSNRNFCFANLRPENVLLELNIDATKAIHLIEDIQLVN